MGPEFQFVVCVLEGGPEPLDFLLGLKVTVLNGRYIFFQSIHLVGGGLEAFLAFPLFHGEVPEPLGEVIQLVILLSKLLLQHRDQVVFLLELKGEALGSLLQNLVLMTRGMESLSQIGDFDVLLDGFIPKLPCLLVSLGYFLVELLDLLHEL